MNVASIGHGITRLGIDSTAAIVIEVILGEPDAGMTIGKGLAVVRQGALLHSALSGCHMTWQGCIQPEHLPTSIGQQSHVLLRVMGAWSGCRC